MQPVNTQLRFNEDGTPRRRYEIDEANDRKPMVQVTLGLLLAGAVALIKNVLFPARAEQPAAELTTRDLQPPHIYDDVTSVETDAAITEEPVTETIDGDAYSVLQTKTNQAMATPYYIAPRQHFAGLSHVTSNDNHLLFGAVPGQAVRLNGEYRDEVRALFSQSAGGSRGTAPPPSQSLSDPKSSDSPIKPNNPDNAVDHPAGTDPGTVPKGDTGDPEPKPKQVNRAPVVSGPVRLGHTTANHIVVFTLADFLTTATDADADPLSISNLSASSGTVVANPDGGWSYTPDPNTHGEATFSYKVSDGQEQVAATAVLTIDPVIVIPMGGHGHDHDHGPAHHHHHHRQSYAGTSLHEHGSHPLTAITLILPSAGSASRPIIGTSGNDLIIGTAGNDVISGGGGNDILIGGRGDDTVDGGRGDDTFVATLYDGNDTYDGGAGDHDTLDLQAIHVTTSAERSNAGQAEAVGADSLPAHLASAVATAPCSQTSDVPILELVNQSRVGGCGERDTSADCTVDLQAGTADGDLIGHDRLLNIEDVLGGCGNDVIRGDAHANRLSGGGGDDVLLGRAGNDVLDGGAGRDMVDGGEGNDIIIATADRAADDIRGGAGSDTYDASCLKADATIDLAHGCATSSEIGIDHLVEIENIIGGRGNDTLVANNSVNLFIGGHGNDLFVFSTAESIGKGEGHHDVILDFAVGDRIDIHNISSEFAHALNDLYSDSDIRDFVFIREQDAFSKPGELKLVYDNVHDASHILGSINYDAMIDFDLEVRGYHLVADFNFHAAAIAS